MLFIVYFRQLSPELQITFVLPSHSPHLRTARLRFYHWYVDHSGRCYRRRPRWPYVPVDAATTVSGLALIKVRYILMEKRNCAF